MVEQDGLIQTVSWFESGKVASLGNGFRLSSYVVHSFLDGAHMTRWKISGDWTKLDCKKELYVRERLKWLPSTSHPPWGYMQTCGGSPRRSRIVKDDRLI